jgi:hypothetical protein
MPTRVPDFFSSENSLSPKTVWLLLEEMKVYLKLV